MKRPGSAPSTRLLIGSVVALLATACNSSAEPVAVGTRPRRRPSPRPRPPVAVDGPHHPGRRSPPGPAPTAAPSSAGSSASARARSPPRSARSRRSSPPTTRRRRTSTSSTRSSTTPRPRTSSRREIAAGNAPDIIGPVGVEGLNLFADQLLDLKPQIAATGYTSTGVDQSLVDFFNSLGQNGATVGLPFAVYPSFIFYNQDLFEEAGLPLPPTKVGDLYDGKPWDLDALRTLAMKLTVDKNGKDATEAGFDPDNIEQWGFDSQYMDNYNARAETAFFGAGSLLAADGKTAVMPDYIAQGEKWYNDGVWKDHFIPTANQVASDLLSGGQRVRLRQPRDRRGPHLVHVLRHARRPRRSSSSSASPSTRRSTARSPHRSMRTRSASSRRPRCPMRHSRP